jgi:hypothetical protein
LNVLKKTAVELFRQEKAAYLGRLKLLQINPAGKSSVPPLIKGENMILNCLKTARYVLKKMLFVWQIPVIRASVKFTRTVNCRRKRWRKIL